MKVTEFVKIPVWKIEEVTENITKIKEDFKNDCLTDGALEKLSCGISGLTLDLQQELAICKNPIKCFDT